MFIYIFISLILTGLAIINPKSKMIKKIVYLLLGIFLCTSYFNGSDWRHYEVMYKLATFEDSSNFYAEKGFYIYMCIFKILGFSFFEFFIITKFIIYYIFYKFLIKSSNFYLVLNIFYCHMALFLFIDCPFRNLIAIGIVLLGIEKLKLEKKKSFFLYIILASLFHTSAIFFIVLFFIYRINKLSNKKVMLLLILSYILLLNQNILILIVKKLPFFEQRLQVYFNTKYFVRNVFTAGSIEKILLVSMIVLFRDQSKRKWRDYYPLIVLYFVLYRIATSFPILTRFVYYIQVFYIMGIGLIIEDLNKNKIFKNTIILLFFIYNVTILMGLKNRYEYIPYTSYLNYIGKEKPSYKYRSKYNFIKLQERIRKSSGDLRRN